MMLSSLDFRTLEELKQREAAMEELENGESVNWDDYIAERGKTV